MKNFDICNKDGKFAHSVYTVDEKRLKIKSIKLSVEKKACINDDSIECLLFYGNVSTLEESAFENCSELQIVEWTESGNLLGKPDANAIKGAITVTGNVGVTEITGETDKDNVSGNVTVSGSLEINEPKSAQSNAEKIPELSENLIIQYRAFKDCSKLHTLVFPKNDKYKITIEREAFAGCKSLRTVILHGNGTFDIDDNAFASCDTDRLVFVVTEGSGAERFAREHGYRWGVWLKHLMQMTATKMQCA